MKGNKSMTLYRVKVNPAVASRYVYDQVSDSWDKTETEDEYRVQVVDENGFSRLADDDPYIVSYRAL